MNIVKYKRGDKVILYNQKVYTVVGRFDDDDYVFVDIVNYKTICASKDMIIGKLIGNKVVKE